jgi:hypothetical protein
MDLIDLAMVTASLGNGEIEIEYIMNMNMGGFLSDYL